jgi:hypothetical protein
MLIVCRHQSAAALLPAAASFCHTSAALLPAAASFWPALLPAPLHRFGLLTAPRFELPGHFGYKQDTRLQAGTFHPWVSGVGFAP